MAGDTQRLTLLVGFRRKGAKIELNLMGLAGDMDRVPDEAKFTNLDFSKSNVLPTKFLKAMEKAKEKFLDFFQQKLMSKKVPCHEEMVVGLLSNAVFFFCQKEQMATTGKQTAFFGPLCSNPEITKRHFSFSWKKENQLSKVEIGSIASE